MEFNGYHILQCSCVDGAAETHAIEEIRNSFGSGYRSGLLTGSGAGLKSFSIPLNQQTNWEMKTDVDNNRYVFRGRSYTRAQYIYNVFVWQKLSGKPVAVRSPLTGQIYLAEFDESEISLTKALNAVFSTSVKLKQVRLRDDAIYDIQKLSNVYAHLDANYFGFDGTTDGELIDNVIWFDYSGKNHHFGTVNGNNVFSEDEFNGLPAVKFNGNAGASHFQRDDDVIIYEVFALMKFPGESFDYIQGIVSGENGGQVMLATNESGTNLYDLDGTANIYEYELNGIAYPNSAAPAPFGDYKVVRVRYESGVPLTKVQIGKDREYTNRYGDFYLQTIILCDGLLTEIESRELTEYLLSRRKSYLPIELPEEELSYFTIEGAYLTINGNKLGV